jgi:hypothetical protein
MRTFNSLSAVLCGIAMLTAGCADSSNSVTGTRDSANGSRPQAGTAHRTTIEGRDGVRIVSASGDIGAAVGEFRDLLGSLNPNVAGEQPGGRREINWDGVPAALTNTDNFPGTFFNVNSPRGVLFTTDGSGFRISDNGYTDVNAAYAGEFVAFSKPKLFVARGSTVTDVRFVVAGSNTQALVSGFGSVFEDVGRANSTTIEYFDIDGNRILKIAAPRAIDATGISFLGAAFDSAVVARVRITSGDTPIGGDVEDVVKGEGQKRDIVAMDDFIYGEPRAPRGAN